MNPRSHFTPKGMDIILSADVRHSLTECMTDVYLLAWDIFYQKFGGESIQEDMTRIRIYVNGNPNYLKESIHGDLGPRAIYSNKSSLHLLKYFQKDTA